MYGLYGFMVLYGPKFPLQWGLKVNKPLFLVAGCGPGTEVPCFPCSRPMRRKQSGRSIDQGVPSLKLTWPLKIDGWKMYFLLGMPIFRGYVSFKECIWGCTPCSKTWLLKATFVNLCHNNYEIVVMWLWHIHDMITSHSCLYWCDVCWAFYGIEYSHCIIMFQVLVLGNCSIYVQRIKSMGVKNYTHL